MKIFPMPRNVVVSAAARGALSGSERCAGTGDGTALAVVAHEHATPSRRGIGTVGIVWLHAQHFALHPQASLDGAVVGVVLDPGCAGGDEGMHFQSRSRGRGLDRTAQPSAPLRVVLSIVELLARTSTCLRKFTARAKGPAILGEICAKKLSMSTRRDLLLGKRVKNVIRVDTNKGV